MITGFEKIVEERICQAQRNGMFENLPGAGKPLNLEDSPRIPEDLRLAYKILRNSGFTPPEIEIKKEILTTETLFNQTMDVHLKYKMLKKLNYLVMKFNLLRQGSVACEIPQKYEERLIDRMSTGYGKGVKSVFQA